MNELKLNNDLSRIVSDYTNKIENLEENMEAFMDAQTKFRSQTLVLGTWCGVDVFREQKPWLETAKKSLLKSAWKCLYKELNIERVATAKDKEMFDREMEQPPEFTIDNVRATFGDYLQNPMANILRGLAEVFCTLDPAYKSHSKVKIGVDGLPKRVIIGGLDSFHGYGRDKIKNILDAIAQYQGKPLLDYRELNALMDDENALLEDWSLSLDHKSLLPKEHENPPKYPARGVRLRRFKNGNGHLFFEPETLKDINRALAAYYGDVLADCYTEEEMKTQSTAVAKDLQYYPTPTDVVNRVLDDCYQMDGKRVLEPSCGCGRFMDAIKEKGGIPFGVEFDSGRVRECKAKGHDVLQGNFLEMTPREDFDFVIMNPPFYGKHYAKHVEHALKFLKPGGVLKSVLPITARYDHGLLNGRWDDLPVGSFRESGTNINTTVLTIRKE